MNTQKGDEALRVANAIPPGVRSEWMLAGGWIAIILGLIGSATSSGGTMPGFLVSLFLNPILFLAGFWFWRYTKVKCPHCGGLNSLDQIALGTTVRCAKCKNAFAKPGHGHSTQPVQVIVAPIADKSDADSTVHAESRPVKAVVDYSRREVATPAQENSNAPAEIPQPQMIFTLEDAIKFREYEESLKARNKDEDEARRRESLEYEAKVKADLSERDAQRQREEREREAAFDEKQRQAKLKHAEELAAVERQRLADAEKQTTLSSQSAKAWADASRKFGPVICVLMLLVGVTFAAGAVFFQQKKLFEQAKLQNAERERLVAEEIARVERLERESQERQRRAAERQAFEESKKKAYAARLAEEERFNESQKQARDEFNRIISKTPLKHYQDIIPTVPDEFRNNNLENRRKSIRELRPGYKFKHPSLEPGRVAVMQRLFDEVDKFFSQCKEEIIESDSTEESKRLQLTELEALSANANVIIQFSPLHVLQELDIK